ncbi:hypothetical protein ES705_24094 [subsurface metagenome]
MSSGIIVGIRTRPYMKDYIVSKYGLGSEPVRATTSNKVFPLLSQYLTHKPVNWRPPQAAEDIILFELPYNEVLNVRTRCYIHEDNFPEITSFFYGMFYTHFINYMNSKCLDQKKIWRFKYAIYNFMDENSISIDNINYDSLKRIYLRYRKQFENFNEREFDERSKKKQKKVNHFS